MGMDPITLIVAALAAGAAVGLKGAASSGVTGAYTVLKALVSKRLSGGPGGDLVRARDEEVPETWWAPLMAELDRAGAGHDPGLVAAAALMRLVDEAGARAGKYAVVVRGAQGVQIGDHDAQHSVFGALPCASGPAGSGLAPDLPAGKE
jgi:hypothetical protein